ncbi:uncharacterized protein RSE6_04543 [Rhynchosporium secalis]|uniref:Uncharacterized protein n=1 Tax=Rhynchosporium secalis TaxID=38038 RepID=A0A1E1M5M5_RHYSE|nr:uncharacterized protein RSE6_04543 [Rhynchosporium secalis]
MFARRPLVILGCVFWLLVNLYQLLGNFIPKSNLTSKPSIHDEEYTAHPFDALSWIYGVQSTEYGAVPVASHVHNTDASMLFYNADKYSAQHTFSDSPTTEFSVYTPRIINTTYICASYRENFTYAETANDALVSKLLRHQKPNRSTTFAILPRVYPDNVSFISDNMIQIATASIAQVGYRDDLGFAVQIYPRAGFWVILVNGSTVEVGNMISVFAIGVIIDATKNNSYTDNVGTAPMRGIYLGHS